MSDQKHYLLVLSHGPLMILRVPWPMPRWRKILRATTGVMHVHGLRQKDVLALDGMVASDPALRDEKDRSFAARVDKGFDGDKNVVPRFWLYDWVGDEFKLARAALEAGQ